MSGGDKIILVTGFGPFGEHKVNASWEAVKNLPDCIQGFKVIKKEIPVVYKYVEEQVPLLWKTYSPILVVHVGVSGYANKITLETQAFASGYHRSDCEGFSHPTGNACVEDVDCIKGTIDIDAICDRINQKENLMVCASSDAGRYLCEFIYFKSLMIDDGRTMFIHVPPLDKPYSAQQLATGIFDVIICALDQTENCICQSKSAIGF